MEEPHCNYLLTEKPFTSCSPFRKRPNSILTASLVNFLVGMRRRGSSHFLYEHSSLPLFRIPSPRLFLSLLPSLFIALFLLHRSLVFFELSFVHAVIDVSRGRIVLGEPWCQTKIIEEK